MGSLFSSPTPPERQPLLAHPPPSPDPLPEAHTPLEKGVDVIAALNTGKLPSQEQINHFLRFLVHSSILSRPDDGYQGLSQRGRQVLADVRQVLEALLEIGAEKNDDDLLQEFLYHCSELESASTIVQVDPNALDDVPAKLSHLQSEAPSVNELETDMTALVQSLVSLTSFVMTSAALRILITNILVTTRQVVAHAAVDVSVVASQVQVAADDVQRKALDPDASGWEHVISDITEDVKEVGETVRDTTTRWQEKLDSTNAQKAKSGDFMKDIVIARVQETILLAHQDPKCKRAFLTTLTILRKYATYLSTSSSSSSSHLAPAIHLQPPLSELKTLIERLGSNTPLDPLFDSITTLLTHIATSPSPALRNYFSEVGAWLNEALADPVYVSSRVGLHRLEELYDAGKELLTDDEPSSTPVNSAGELESWSVREDLRTVVDRFDFFVSALKTDRGTTKLIRSLDTLSVDAGEFRQAGVKNKNRMWGWDGVAAKDVLGWVLPKMFEWAGRSPLVKLVPMPRVEWKSRRVEGALDALLMRLGTAGSSSDSWGSDEDEETGRERFGAQVAPDQLRVETWNWSEVRVDMRGLSRRSSGSGAHRSVVQTATTTRVKVHVDGVRMAAQGVGYYVRYIGTILGYTDEGVVSLDIGNGKGKGDGSEEGRGVGVVVEVEIGEDAGAAVDTDGGGVMPGTFGDDDDNGDGDGNVEEKLKPLFRVVDVEVTFHGGLSIAITQSKHWILNKLFVQPLLSGSLLRRVVAGAMEEQVRKGLEGVEVGMRGIVGDARRKGRERARRDNVEGGAEEEADASPTTQDYWAAIVEGAPTMFGRADEGDAGDGAEAAVETSTSARPTMKGIILTTTAVPPGDARDTGSVRTADSGVSATEPRGDETVIAVGGGAQLFPGKGGAYGAFDGVGEGVEVGKVVGETVEQAREEVMEGVERAKATAIGVAESVAGARVRVREGLERAGEREREVERVEGQRTGWRSDAFDW